MSPALFVLVYFSDSVLHFCPGLALDHNPPISPFQVAGVIGINHHAEPNNTNPSPINKITSGSFKNLFFFYLYQ
jgi:hypothetical protein